jgi:uncharacterized protein YjbI with pentapeptide repeats
MVRGNDRFGLWRRGREPKLIPIGIALGGTLVLALALAAVLAFLGIHYLHVRGFQAEPRLSADTLYNLLKVVFAFTAGVGGVFALVTAYRRQRVSEFADRRETSRAFNERFTTAAEQLGHDQPAIRLAGVYAMGRLADDWPQQRQTCVDVLCAYLRMPYQPDPGEDAEPGERQAFRAAREVRHTVIRVITAHLQPEGRRPATMQDWHGLDLDFTGTIFDGGSFDEVEFSSGTVSFNNAEFSSGTVSFNDAQFSGARVSFSGAQFSGAVITFDSARFSAGGVSFRDVKVSDGRLSFSGAQFSGGRLSFFDAQFSGGGLSFSAAQFSDGAVSFTGARFSGGAVSFDRGRFSGGRLSFDSAQFSSGTVDFSLARFSGSELDFTAATWRNPPMGLSWSDPPDGVSPPLQR